MGDKDTAPKSDKATDRVVEDGKEGIRRTKELLGRLLKVPKSAIPPKK